LFASPAPMRAPSITAKSRKDPAISAPARQPQCPQGWVAVTRVWTLVIELSPPNRSPGVQRWRSTGEAESRRWPDQGPPRGPFAAPSPSARHPAGEAAGTAAPRIPGSQMAAVAPASPGNGAGRGHDRRGSAPGRKGSAPGPVPPQSAATENPCAGAPSSPGGKTERTTQPPSTGQVGYHARPPPGGPVKSPGEITIPGPTWQAVGYQGPAPPDPLLQLRPRYT